MAMTNKELDLDLYIAALKGQEYEAKAERLVLETGRVEEFLSNSKPVYSDFRPM